MKQTKSYFTIKEMEKALFEIKKQIKKSAWIPEIIISVNRGGCVPGVYLSHMINIPHKVVDVQLRDNESVPNLMVLDNCINTLSNILIIDDINDTGATFNFIKNRINQQDLSIFFAVLIDNNSSKFKVDFRGKIIDKIKDPSWIIFPWEKD
jgi:hypoxanthine phosphoribosyltransferase